MTEGPTDGPGGVGRPPVGLGRVGSPSRRSGNGWEALPEGRQESGGILGVPEGVGRAGIRWKALS